MKRVNLHLPLPMLKALKDLAKRTGLTVADHVRRAVERYLDGLKAKP